MNFRTLETVSRTQWQDATRKVAANALMVLAFLLAPRCLMAQTTTSETLKVEGVDRAYLLHLPSGYKAGQPMPLLLMLHGANMTAQLMADVSGLNRWSDKAGFIAVYPQGIERRWHVEAIDATANAQTAAATRNDFDFVASLIARIEGGYAIDKSRVILAGISNGGEFAQELACREDLRFRVVVSVSGPLQRKVAESCAPKHPVRLISLHGTADPIVPYLGGRVAVPGGGPEVIPVADDLAMWARIDACSPNPAVERLPSRLPAHQDDGTYVERMVFKGCAAGGEVTHYRIVGGGHVWPGVAIQPAVLGHATQQIDASELIAGLLTGATPD